MGKAEPLDPATLLAQASWVRRLAGRLLFDAAAADDVAQETLAAALRHAPGDRRSLRAWLAGVVRNLVRARTRADANREQREASSHVVTPPPSAADVVERGETFRLVVQAVFELPEPYRSTVLMRYFDGLSTAQIAEQTGLSAGAVRTRHSRGLALLREDLDRRHGGDARTWLTALAPLALPLGTPLPAPPVTPTPTPSVPSGSFPRPALPVAATGGVLLMSTKAILVTATILPALVLGGLWLRAERATPSATPGEETAVMATEAVELEPTTPAATRSPVEVPAKPAEPAETAFVHPPISASFQREVAAKGFVIDLDGRPVAGVTVELRHADSEPPITTESLADGSFEIPAKGFRGELIARDQQYAAVFHALFTGFRDLTSDSDPKPMTLVVAPRGRFEGEVLDADGRPIAAARLRVALPSDLRTHFDAILDSSMPEEVTAETDAEGRFALDAACVPGSKLVATKNGFRSEELELPAVSTFDLRFALGNADETLLMGRVIDARARPVAGAKVGFGWISTVTGEDGRFQFDLEEGRGEMWEPDEVIALHPGFLPKRVKVTRQPGGERPGFLTLELDQTSLSIAGKVVWPDGKPVPDAPVYVMNPMFFGAVQYQEGESFVTADIEQLLNENTSHNVPLATTDAQGSFVARGLLPREYEFFVVEPETLRRVRSEPVLAPAEGVVIELEPSEPSPIAGRIVDSSGQAMPGLHVVVNVVRPVDRVGLPFGGGFGEYFYTKHNTMTGADGRFELAALDPRDVRLQIYRPGAVAVFHVELATIDQPLDDLLITAHRRCHFFVELSGDPDLADSFELLDEKGATVPLVFGRGDMTMHSDTAELTAGRSETISASEAARTLVLRRAGEIVERLPIELSPDETRRIGI